MTVETLLANLMPGDSVELHSAHNGRLLAISKDAMKRYWKDAQILSISPQIKLDRECTVARAYLHVYIPYVDENRICARKKVEK